MITRALTKIFLQNSSKLYSTEVVKVNSFRTKHTLGFLACLLTQVLLEDCSSAVGGFEGAAAEFVAEMKAAGVTVTTSDQLSWDA
jgi:hypothetical protein